MPDPAVFQGSLVDLKNVGTHKSVRLIVEVPEEYGEAIVRAFGWPTRVKPVSVAVARLEGDGEQIKQPERQPEPRHFDDLSYAEQAGIICKDPDFKEFLQSTAPYKNAGNFIEGWTPEALVRSCCGVQSRADIKEDNKAGRQWRIILNRFRRWQDERNRNEIDF